LSSRQDSQKHYEKAWRLVVGGDGMHGGRWQGLRT